VAKVLKTAAIVVGAVALVATGVGVAALGAASLTAAAATTTIAGISASTLFLASAGLSVAAGLLTKKPVVGAGGSQTAFKADPDAGIPYLIGRTGTGGNIVFRGNADGWSDKTPNDLSDFVIVQSLGPIQGFESFKVDQAVVTFNGSGNAIGGFANYMWLTSQLGATPEPASLAVAAGASPRPSGWASSAKLSGLAASQWRLRFDAKGERYQNGTPKPQWIALGVKVYDPRLDSTYPGGSGSCRWNDESSWVYSENPYLHALTWLIGRVRNGVRVMGVGAAIAGIIVANFVEGANVAQANGWKVGGTVYSTDSKWEVLKAILQAGAGEPLRLGAQIGCLVQTPRVSLATIGVDDIAQGDVVVQATQPQRDRINGVIPRYRSEDHDWEIVPAAPVRVAAFVTEDGGQQRTREIEYPLVQCAAGQQPVQVAQLARYDIQNAREFGPITLPLKLRWMGYKPGDCLTVNLPEDGLNNQLVLLLNRSLEPATGAVTMTARSETSAKHGFALGQTTTPPPLPSLSGPPLVPTPASGDWTIAATSISSGGVTVPALVITGSAPSSIEAIVFEYRAYTGPGMALDAGWSAAGLEAPKTTAKAITAVTGSTEYQVSVSYRARGTTGGRLILGPTTTASHSGVAGPPGADGSPTYIWVAYADSADGTVNFTNGAPGARTYLGLAPNKSSPTESSTPSDYSWSKVQGPQGPSGDQGVPGPPGDNGEPTYIWVAYADSADGTVNFTTGAPGTRTYLGLAPNKSTPTESSTPGDYNWSKIQGPQGPTGDPGEPGEAGFTLSGGGSASVAATAGGTPKTGELPKTFTMKVMQGTVDRSDEGATTYSITASSGCTASLGGTNGKVLSVTAMSADTASVTVTILRSGVAVGTQEARLSKARDGSSANANKDDTLAAMPASSTPAQLGSFTIIVPNGASLSISADVAYFGNGAGSNTYGGEIRASYTVDGTETFGNWHAGDITASNAEQAFASFSADPVYANTSGVTKEATVRLYGKRAFGTSGSSGTTGKVEGTVG
jgi:IS1 family transposase